MSWRDKPLEERLVKVFVGAQLTAYSADECAKNMIEAGVYAYGDHVEDPTAIVSRYLQLRRKLW